MGLTSGTMWASSNVGANAPEESGTYYAWGKWDNGVTLPSKEQVNELIAACSWDIEKQNGKDVICATSNANGNKIYFPFSGYKTSDVKNAEYFGSIWTSTEAESGNAYCSYFYNAYKMPESETTLIGLSAKSKSRNIRAVKTK